MKRQVLVFAVLMGTTSFAMASLCTDLAASYNQQLTALKVQFDAAYSATTDKNEAAALQSSYLIQQSQLQAEETGALTSAGCTDGSVQVPPTSGGTTTPPTNTGGGTTTPPGDTGGGTVTPPGDTGGSNPPGDTGGDQQSCQEQLNAFAHSLLPPGATNVDKHMKDVVARVRDEAHRLGCNYGQWRSSINSPEASTKHSSFSVGCGRRS